MGAKSAKPLKSDLMVLEQLLWSLSIYVWSDRLLRFYWSNVWDCDGIVLWTKICQSHLDIMASH